MTDDQREAVLKHVKAGLGRYAALERLGVSYSELRYELQDDSDFRDQIIMAERSLEHQCMAVILEDALQNSSVNSASLYVKLTRDNRYAKAKYRFDSQRLQLAGKITSHITADQGSVTFRDFSIEETNEYASLYDKIRQDVELTGEEAIRFAKLMSKASRPSEPTIEGRPSMKQIAGGLSDEE